MEAGLEEQLGVFLLRMISNFNGFLYESFDKTFVSFYSLTFKKQHKRSKFKRKNFSLSIFKFLMTKLQNILQ